MDSINDRGARETKRSDYWITKYERIIGNKEQRK
jgi:hypothetical protein